MTLPREEKGRDAGLAAAAVAESRELNRRTSALAIAGTRRLGIGIALQRGAQVLAMILLARLLVPEDFGLMSAAAVILEFANMMRDLGMSKVLIQRREHPAQTANVLFFSSWILTAFVYGIVLLAAPVVSSFLGNSRAGTVVAVLGLQLFLEAAITVPRALAGKELDVNTQVRIAVLETSINAIVCVLLAMAGYGVWSLVCGALSGGCASALAWNLTSPWRPSWSGWDWKVARDMARFGVTLTAAGALESASDLSTRGLIGGVLGVGPLGLYDVSSRSVNLVFRHAVVAVGERIALPAFCKVQEDRAQICAWFLKMVSYSCLMVSPLAVALVVLADILVPLVLGPKWLATVPLMRVLGPLVIVMPLMYGRPVYVAMGRGDLLLRFVGLRLLISVPFILLAARFGLLAVCATELAVTTGLAVVNLIWIARLIGLSVKRLAVSLAFALKEGACFLLILLALRLLFSYLFGNWNLAYLVLLILAAGPSYVFLVYLGHRDTFWEICSVAGFRGRHTAGTWEF